MTDPPLPPPDRDDALAAGSAIVEMVAKLVDRVRIAEAWADEHECEDVAGGALDAQAEAEQRMFEQRARAEKAEASLAALREEVQQFLNGNRHEHQLRTALSLADGRKMAE
jgi:hypothetical protein